MKIDVVAELEKSFGDFGAVVGAWGVEKPDELALADSSDALCAALADRYIDIVQRDSTQSTFLRGWIRRAIRRP